MALHFVVLVADLVWSLGALQEGTLIAFISMISIRFETKIKSMKSLFIINRRRETGRSP